jgi:methylmalonyl-CoA/ethylmalonyl-CoA epimerase
VSGAPAIQGLAHVGVAVRSLDEAVASWTGALGFELVGTESLPGMHLRLAFLRAGSAEIELLEATSPDSPVGRFLERRGEGIHHLSFYVANLETALADAERRGLALIDRTPREGSRGSRIAFLHPRALHGVLVELCERHVA